MAITKTKFINYTRCPRFVALDDLKDDVLSNDISYLEYIKELDKKLLEEAHEFIEEHSIEELGDLMEVIFSIMKLEKIETNEVEKSRIDKKNKKGGFDNKIYLNFVEQDKPDEKEEQELKKEWRN